jgi:hypothetical protein
MMGSSDEEEEEGVKSDENKDE